MALQGWSLWGPSEWLLRNLYGSVLVGKGPTQQHSRAAALGPICGFLAGHYGSVLLGEVRGQVHSGALGRIGRVLAYHYGYVL